MKHQGTFKRGRKGKKKKGREKKAKAVCFSAVFPKTFVNTCASCLTTVSGDRDLPGSSVGGRRNIPIPELSAYVGSWFPGHTGLRAALLQPWSTTSTLSHKLLGPGASASRPQPAQCLGKAKQKQAACSPPLPPKDEFEMICSCCAELSTFGCISPFSAPRGREGKGKAKPRGGRSSGKSSPPAETSQWLLAFLSLCTF